MRFALTRICQRAALSVICFANASSPKGRAEKPVRTAHLTHQSKPHADLPACCPLSHLLRKCQLSQGESREAGADCAPDESGYLLRRSARVLLLPSRLAPRHLPQGGRLWFSAQSNLSLSLGEMSRSDREGWLLLSVLPLHRWRGPPPLSGEAKFGSPERGAVTE